MSDISKLTVPVNNEGTITDQTFDIKDAVAREAIAGMDFDSLGSLAYKDSASGNFTPSGTISVTKGADTKSNVKPFGSAGTLPSFSVSGETLSFNTGTLPTGGTDVSVVTATGNVSATFNGVSGSVTVN